MANVSDFRRNIVRGYRDNIFEMSTDQRLMTPAQYGIRFRENQPALSRNRCSAEFGPFLFVAEGDGLTFSREALGGRSS